MSFRVQVMRQPVVRQNPIQVAQPMVRPATYVATSVNPSRFHLAMKHCNVMHDILLTDIGEDIEVQAPVLLEAPVRRISSAHDSNGALLLAASNPPAPTYVGNGMLLAAASPRMDAHVDGLQVGVASPIGGLQVGISSPIGGVSGGVSIGASSGMGVSGGVQFGASTGRGVSGGVQMGGSIGGGGASFGVGVGLG
jgi:hypothetical protein